MSTDGLSFLDYLIVAADLVAVIVLGYIVSKKQKTTSDYFLAGRNMHWLPVAISIFATLFSAMSFIGAPAEAYRYDMQMGLGCFAMIFVAPIIVTLFVRFYHRLGVFTAYEYLEQRFHLSIRILASLLFMLLRLGWISAVLYASAIVLETASNIALVWAILISGVVATAYVYMGGIRAVIWTDVMHFLIFWIGILLMVGIVLFRIGGWQVFWETALEHNKLTLFDFSFDPSKRITFWSVAFGFFFLKLGGSGVDQVVIQRYLTTASVKQASKSIYFFAFIVSPAMIVFYFLGVLLFVFYQVHPEWAVGMGSTDHVVPFFIMTQLPTGFRGLLITAIFAAAISSVDSGLNSVATAATNDFYKRLFFPNRTDQQYFHFARFITFFFGALVTAGAILISRLQIGTIAELFFKLSQPFVGILLGIFLLGMLTRRGNTTGALLGAAAGTAIFAAIRFVPGSFLGDISFLWNAPICFLASFVPGYLLSFVSARPSTAQLEGLTVFTIDREA